MLDHCRRSRSVAAARLVPPWRFRFHQSVSVKPAEPLSPRLDREQRTIEAMLRIYCRGHHGATGGLCGECEDLLTYAGKRLRACPFQEAKPACNQCPIHCYAPALRERAREVMRYAGPRMLRRHPWLALTHLFDTLRPIPEWPRQRRSRPGGSAGQQPGP
jgi:hypothetical protein